MFIKRDDSSIDLGTRDAAMELTFKLRRRDNEQVNKLMRQFLMIINAGKKNKTGDFFLMI